MSGSYYNQLKEAYTTQEKINRDKQLGLQAPYAKDILKTIRRYIDVSSRDIEIAGCKCKQISIILPECEGSHGSSLTFSISNEEFSKESLKEKLEGSSKLQERLYNKNDFFSGLRSINKIMESFGLPTDSNIEDDDSGWRLRGYMAIKFIKELLKGNKELKRLNSVSLWLNDSKEYENNKFQARIDSNQGIIDYVGEKRSAHMLLK